VAGSPAPKQARRYGWLVSAAFAVLAVALDKTKSVPFELVLAFYAAAGLLVVCWLVLLLYTSRFFPWELRRKGQSDLPAWTQSIPYYLKPANGRVWVANHLIERGYAVLNAIPQTPEPSELQRALAQPNPLMRDHFREVVYWEQDVYTFLSVRARECQALFRRGPIPRSYRGLREYIERRLEELETIHGRLRG
jgi:hypothetical protein